MQASGCAWVGRRDPPLFRRPSSPATAASTPDPAGLGVRLVVAVLDGTDEVAEAAVVLLDGDLIAVLAQRHLGLDLGLVRQAGERPG